MKVAPLPERRQLTVMLCDLAGWTALSLRLDPEDLSEVIQAYRQRCASIITDHGGTVAQYVGDAVLAYFGYPRAHEDDAERAVRAALAIADPAEASCSETAASSVRVGIATGIVVVGNLAGRPKSAAAGGDVLTGREPISAVGTALNLAARLQTLAEPGMVVVSEQTRRLTGGVFEYNDLGEHDLKGFGEPLQAWEAVCESTVRSRFHALRASSLTPLVNRQSELQALRQLWDSALAGHGKAVLLSSEPGVGKSRLAEEVARRIVGRRCLRHWWYCSPHSQSSPLAPLIRQLTRAAGFSAKDDDDAKLRKLVALLPQGAGDADEVVPLLADLLSVPYENTYPALNMSAQRHKHRLFQVLMQLLESFAARAPVLLVVEDLHWVDPSSDELLGILLERLKALPILAILTARMEFQSHWDDCSQLVHMHLSPLERRDAITMIELLCGPKGMPEATIAQIADKTDGLPLFIEDLTRDVLELADRQDVSSGATIPPKPLAFTIPTTLTDSLMSRLDRLGSAKTVAQIGAAIGREFSYALLASVADMPEEHFKEELYRLVDSGLLISRRSTAVQAYAFKHALVRDVAYSSLLNKARVSLHARIARSLLEDLPETAETQPEILAYHFQAANDIDNAVHYLIKAAKLSAKRSGFVEAIAQLDGALSLLGTQQRSKVRMQQELRVYLALGGINAEYRGFSSAECGRAYSAALALCRELGDAPEIFMVLSGVGSFEITRAGFDTCRALAEETLARAAQQPLRPPFIMGHVLLGGTLFLTGELQAARRHLEEAIRLYDQGQRPKKGSHALYVQDQKSTGLCHLALTLTLMGFLDGGLRAAQSGLAHSRSLGGLHTVNFSLCYLAAVCHIRGDSEQALRYATESLELAREQGFATWIGISQAIRGASLAGRGEHEQGLKEIADGLAAHSAMEAVTYQAYALSILATELIAVGRLEEALDVLSEALTLSERTGDQFYLAELLRLKGEALAGQGLLSEAEHWLAQAVELSRRQGARLFELRSATSLCKWLDPPRRQTMLQDVLRPVCDWFEEGAGAPDLQDARAMLAGRSGMRAEDRCHRRGTGSHGAR